MSNVLMDPEFAPLLDKPGGLLRDATVVREAIAAARQSTNALRLSSGLEIEDRHVPAVEGQKQVPMRLYRNKNPTSNSPVLLYLHGGGFFCGDLFSDELQCAHYALHAQCTVVCVDYRLAPEDPFPAALMDCYRVLEHLWEESRNLGLDRNSIVVGGSSAGANLAAALALLARDRMGPRLCFQMLVVPALDDRLETPSSRQFTDVPDFARADAEIMWRWYLGEETRDASPYAAPARAKDLSGLPPAYILCAGMDPLRDEGINYALRLIEAGVQVELHTVPSIPHGFASVPSAEISNRLLAEQTTVLRKAVHGNQAADGRSLQSGRVI